MGHFYKLHKPLNVTMVMFYCLMCPLLKRNFGTIIPYCRWPTEAWFKFPNLKWDPLTSDLYCRPCWCCCCCCLVSFAVYSGWETAETITGPVWLLHHHLNQTASFNVSHMACSLVGRIKSAIGCGRCSRFLIALSVISFCKRYCIRFNRVTLKCNPVWVGTHQADHQPAVWTRLKVW